ncbi:MAG: S8 family peptidase [Streptosporangiaceae bacterium]
MPVRNSREQELDPKIRDQVNYIISEFEANGTPVDYVTAPREPGQKYSAGVSYMYAQDQLLVRQRDLPEVLGLLRKRFRLGPKHRELKPFIGDIVLVELVPDTSGGDNVTPAKRSPHSIDECAAAGHVHSDGEQPCVPEILAAIDEEHGVAVATPNQVVTVCGGDMGPCPATEPQEVYDGIEPYPGVCCDNGGSGVRIWIADTGLLDGATQTHSWLNGVDGDKDDRPWTGGFIPVYAGHGTFVAGVVRCMAPAADIYVANVFDIAGSALESSFVPKLNDALGYGADIIHLTISTLTRKGLPLQGVGAWIQTLGQDPGVACVVAAGNDGTDTPSWPAAFPTMVSVGALAGDWHSRANFSNYGSWVDVYAPGRDLINAYADGTYECEWAPYKGVIRHFYGMAKWSGTSFSTPIVTGLIAARMARTGESGQVAAQALLAKAGAQAIAGVGPVLLPGCGDAGD